MQLASPHPVIDVDNASERRVTAEAALVPGWHTTDVDLAVIGVHLQIESVSRDDVTHPCIFLKVPMKLLSYGAEIVVVPEFEKKMY